MLAGEGLEGAVWRGNIYDKRGECIYYIVRGRVQAVKGKLTLTTERLPG